MPIDAAVAMTLVEGLVNPQMNTLGGECPILVRLAGESRVIALNGNMAAPMAATPEAFRARGYDGRAGRRRARGGRARHVLGAHHRAEEVGHDELARGFGAGARARFERVCGLGGAAPAAQVRPRRPARKVPVELAGKRAALPAGRRRARGRAPVEEPGARPHARLPGERQGPARGVLPRRRGERDREILQGARRLPRPRRPRGLRDAHRGADFASLRRHRALQVRLLDAGSGRAADHRADVALRPEGDRCGQRGLLSPAHRGDEACLCRPRAVLRRSAADDDSGRGALSEDYTDDKGAADRSRGSPTGSCARATPAAMPRCSPRTSASRPRTGARARCTWTRSTRKATWPPSRRAAPGSSPPR